MPLYMDHHKNLEGLTAEAVAEANKKNLEVHNKNGAKALRYWFNEEQGEGFLLFEAPSDEAAEAIHHEAHGNGNGKVAAKALILVQRGEGRDRRGGQGRLIASKKICA